MEHHHHMDHSEHGNHTHGHPQQSASAHNHHLAHALDMRNRFWIALLLTLPILILSPLFQELLNYTLDLPYDNLALALLSAVVFIYGGMPFHKGAYREIKAFKPGMMTLVSMATTLAFGYSTAVALGLSGHSFYWESASLIDVMLLGHWFEMRSTYAARSRIEDLVELLPDISHVMVNGRVEDRPTRCISPGDRLLIKPGEHIPADGTVLKGGSAVDEHLLTGESRFVEKIVGHRVIGGSMNGIGSMEIEVTRSGEETYLQRMIQMVADTRQKKSATQKMADRAAGYLTLLALLVGGFTLVYWLMSGAETAFAIERSITVMVICCPHALGLAVPLVSAISLGANAKQGVLIRNGSAYENMRKIRRVAFDKTGTLTEGKLSLLRIKSTGKYAESELLSLAASLELSSEHHLARSLLQKAREKELKLHAVKEINHFPGVGVEGKFKNATYRIGGPKLLEGLGVDHAVETSGEYSTIFLVEDLTVIGEFTFGDHLRYTAKLAVHELQQLGIEVVIISGDHKSVVERVAASLAADRYLAEVLPHQKMKEISQLQNEGLVAMVGDGVNDAPALAQADIGIAVGSGTDITADTADIILVDSEPHNIVKLVQYSKKTYHKMVQNLVWATAYNIVALPLATGLFAGVVITPALGALLMSASTVVCALNAQLLRRQLK